MSAEEAKKAEVTEEAKSPAKLKESVAAAEAVKSVKENGSCYCGAVKFTIEGPAMGGFWCHCRACTRSKAAGPSLLFGIGGGDGVITYTEGKDKVKTSKPPQWAPLCNTFCGECGSHIVQWPEGAPFRGVYPATFEYESGKNTAHTGADDKSAVAAASCELPEQYRPGMHLNYENRLLPVNDDLPKFKNAPPAFGGDGSMLNNDVTPKEATKAEEKAEEKKEEKKDEAEGEKKADAEAEKKE